MTRENLASGETAYRALIGAAAAATALSLAAAAPAAAVDKRPAIVVVGDSLGVGAKPVGSTGYVTSEGYAGRLAKDLHGRLVNFACAGATTTSALTGGACTTLGSSSYGGDSQVGAAQSYIKAHQAEVKEVVVELGINDGLDPSAAPRLEANMNLITRGLRDAAGPQKNKVKFVGVTYYDLLLPAWIVGGSANQALAKNSVALIHDRLNTPLTNAFRQNHFAVADVGKAFGNDLPFSKTVTMAGTVVPAAVNGACTYTYGCDAARPDIHLRMAGDYLVAKTIEAAR